MGNRSFHSLFDIFSCKVNPEICLFRLLWEAEKRVPSGIAWVREIDDRFRLSQIFADRVPDFGEKQFIVNVLNNMWRNNSEAEE